MRTFVHVLDTSSLRGIVCRVVFRSCQCRGQGTQGTERAQCRPSAQHVRVRLLNLTLRVRLCHLSHNFFNPRPRTPDMRNQRFVRSRVLALLLPVTLGLGCGLKRDWNICAPEDKQPCLPGYVCTADLKCVPAGDGGRDALLAVDSGETTDAAGGAVDGSAGGSDVVGPADVPASVPDALERVIDAAPTGGAGGGSGNGGAIATGGAGTGGTTGASGGTSLTGGTGGVATGGSGGASATGGTGVGGVAGGSSGTSLTGGTGAGGASGSGGTAAIGGMGAGGATGGRGGTAATGGTSAGGASGSGGVVVTGGSGAGGMSSSTALLANGRSCSAGNACSSGFCVDGVCCNNACSGCNACSQTFTGQANGSCSPVPAGLDPHDTCADERGTNQCGNDGTCDGSGACRKVATSHQCTPASCDGGSFTPASNCNGTGACTTVTPQGCGAFQCSVPDGCKTTCTTQADCGSQSYCNTSTGSCLPKLATGAACTPTTGCLSGYCVDGVCCESACSGTCQACSTAKTGASNGLCRPVSAGSDPDSECAVDTGNACGRDGTCDGVGACRYQVLGTACGSGSCSGEGSYTPRGQCNGSGTCVAGTAGSCAGHLLCASSSTCATNCTDRSTTGCPSGYKCVGGNSCVVATLPCGGGAACQVGNGGNCCVTIAPGPANTPWIYTCLATLDSCATPYRIICNSRADCPAGQFCCMTGISCDGMSAPTPDSSCTADATQCQDGPYNWGIQVCDPNLSPSECLTGTCKSNESCVHGIYSCQ